MGTTGATPLVWLHALSPFFPPWCGIDLREVCPLIWYPQVLQKIKKSYQILKIDMINMWKLVSSSAPRPGTSSCNSVYCTPIHGRRRELPPWQSKNHYLLMASFMCFFYFSHQRKKFLFILFRKKYDSFGGQICFVFPSLWSAKYVPPLKRQNPLPIVGNFFVL